ncbi:MAG: YIP1 family protein [Acidobacteria bacterium]|nr:YIP1 family protein [Acidobacteriota bacterium]
MSASPRGCAHCGTPLGPTARFCLSCGTAVTDGAAAGTSRGPAAGAPAERRAAVPGATPAAAPALWKTVVVMMVNPGAIINRHLDQIAWPVAFAVSGLAFTIFMLQAGLDMQREGTGPGLSIVNVALRGLLLGTVGVGMLGALAWTLARPFGGTRTLPWTMRAFALGYSPTLVYAVCGLAFNLLLGWNTAVAFGVTGLLWSIGPMFATLRETTEGRTGVSVVLSSICGVVMLVGWAVIGLGG